MKTRSFCVMTIKDQNHSCFTYILYKNDWQLFIKWHFICWHKKQLSGLIKWIMFTLQWLWAKCWHQWSIFLTSGAPTLSTWSCALFPSLRSSGGLLLSPMANSIFKVPTLRLWPRNAPQIIAWLWDSFVPEIKGLAFGRFCLGHLHSKFL